MTAGSLSAIAFAPAAAQAAVMTVTGSPVSLPMTAGHLTTANWDVDGADGVDFHLTKLGSSGTGTIYLASITYPSSASLNGRGLVGPSYPSFPSYLPYGAHALQRSFSVGPTLANGYLWGYGSVSGSHRSAMNTWFSFNPGGPTYFIGYNFYYGFNTGDNFIGFRFVDGSDELHYGWANMNFDTDNGVVSITEWAYETEADTAIHIPIPLPGAHALGLLGLGAAGLMKWRQRRKDKAKADA